MPNWLFQHRELIKMVDAFVLQTNNEEFQQTWRYTKRMVGAHALASCPPGMPKEEALSLAWSQFEATFDEEDENALLSLAGIVANFVNAVPYGLSTEFYHTIEIAFSRARGFTQAEAEQQQKERLLATPSWSFFVDEVHYTDEIHREKGFGSLRLIEGGVKSK